MPRVTLQQIADELGFSRATISLALRCDPSIPESTRKKIRECADRLNYQPSPLIAALMADVRSHGEINPTCTLAYVTPFPRERLKTLPSAARYFQGALERAREFGYRLDYFFCEQEAKAQAQLARVLRARGIPGVLLSPGLGDYTVNMPWEWFCAAALGYTLRSPVLSRSVNHQYHTIGMALRKCHEYGYRRIGLLMTDADDERVGHLFSGGFYAFHQRQIPARDRLPILNSFEPGTMKRWVERYRPEVFVTSHQEIHEHLADTDFQFPRDFAMVCLDRAQADQDLAGVDQMPDLVGAAGMDLVIHGLMGNRFGQPASPQTVLIEGKWVDGPSLPRKKPLDAVPCNA